METKDGPRDAEQHGAQEPLLQRSNILPKIVKMENGKSEAKSVDICTEMMGNFGRWQLKTIMIIYLTKIPAAWFMACIIFTAPQPWYEEYRCDLNQYENLTRWIKVENPKMITANGSYQLDYCTVAMRTFDDQTIANLGCEKFNYSINYKTTLVTQFDLLCERNILVAITQCFHLFGVLLGGIAGTYLMERWSPRVVMMMGMISSIPCGLATGYMPWFWMHVAFRCAVAACAAVAFTAGGVIMADTVAGKQKTVVMANFEQYWSIGVLLLPLIGYYNKTWTQIYITITLPMLLIMFLWIWIPDSPRWHLLKGNVDKVQLILESAVKFNGSKVKLPDNLTEIIKEQSAAAQLSEQNMKPQDCWNHLLSIDGMLLKVILVFTSWSLMLTTYYGTLLNIRSFGRQYLYTTTAIAGLCEIVGGFIGFQILYNCQQKWKITGMLTSFTGIVTCFIWFLPVHVDGSHMLSNLLVISMLNKIGISACLCLLMTCTAELFPLPHKKRGVFGSIVMGRIVFMTAPLIGAMAKFGDGVPLTFFGILTVIGGLCAFALKPHKNVPSNLLRVWSTENPKSVTTTKL